MEWLLVLVAGSAGVWWWLKRRRGQASGGRADAAADAGPPEVFNREALLNRPRSFDPGGWDDSPDGDSTPAASGRVTAGDPPDRLDRSQLTRPARPTPAATPVPAVGDETAEDGEEPRFLDREFLERNAKRPAPEPPDPDA